MARLSAELERFFFDESRAKRVTLADILNLSGERTFGFLFVLLALPSALPVPAPGYSIPFGVLLLLIAGQLVIGLRRPWLPRRLLRWGFDLETVQKMAKAATPWLQRIEMLSRPRLTPICTSYPGRFLMGLAIAVMSVSMMIPIPGTNTLPAIGIFVIGFGLLDDDGAISLAGLTLCILAGSLSGVILFAGVKGTSAAVKFLLDLFSTAQPVQ
ncbi:MAG: exopolysaccharide biosynthesis protein [Leptolyngbya sp. SIO1D8]|nr:exopolysaccharide biosynthesis protein [Leptolyngbya sp. SIO1D8]